MGPVLMRESKSESTNEEQGKKSCQLVLALVLLTCLVHNSLHTVRERGRESMAQTTGKTMLLHANARYRVLKSEHTLLLLNLGDQLHAQDKLKGNEFQFNFRLLAAMSTGWIL